LKAHQSARKGRRAGNSDIHKWLFLKELFSRSAPICTESTITPLNTTDPDRSAPLPDAPTTKESPWTGTSISSA
ncbi:hypothetical protein, partial [Acidovorax sp. SD340]|uniref:hypothetical protein n=1 Tax=Acidovorax sp. SD340 TaxID=1690268 RepID=UPI001EE44007